MTWLRKLKPTKDCKANGRKKMQWSDDIQLIKLGMAQWVRYIQSKVCTSCK